MKTLSWWALLLCSLGVAGYALYAYSFLPLGSLVHPDMQVVFNQHQLAIYVHVFGSLTALALGPWQFLSTLRSRYPQLHRWFGRVYLLVGVLLGGLAGLALAQTAFGGLVSIVGFTGSALVWLITGFMAFFCVMKKDFDAHRRWMIRNFTVTFSAVTLRIYLGAFMALGIPFTDFYPLLAWLSWVPNLLIADWLFNRHPAPR